MRYYIAIFVQMKVLKEGQYSGKVTSTYSVNGLIASITGYNEDSFNSENHYHENAHFSFALKGGCLEKKKEDYEITPGHIVYYSAGEYHQVLKVSKPTKRINLEIEAAFFEKFGITDSDARMAVTRNPDVKFLMVKIFNELLTNDRFSEVSIQMVLLQLIKMTPSQGFNNSIPSWVRTVREFLNNHAEETITLSTLSSISNLHPVTISKQFPRYFSCTVGEYKRKLRIEKALKLITANHSLSDVAYECGFFDQSHFIRTFKKMTGFLPQQYQKS
jgi:AraC family transcriptional regulator